jgi:flagellar hook-basal body complex protein FliE
MAIEISSALPASTPSSPAAGVQKAGAATSAFGSLMDAVQSSDNAANSAVAGMLDGSVDLHDAMIALQRADLTLQLSVQIRNKLVQAYQDVMRMPV